MPRKWVSFHYGINYKALCKYMKLTPEQIARRVAGHRINSGRRKLTSTKVLPSDWKLQGQKMIDSIHFLMDSRGITADYVINCDETPIFVENPNNYTYDRRDSKESSQVLTNSHR